MPGPWSDTVILTCRSSSRAAWTVIVVPDGAYLLALSSRMYITSEIEDASTDTAGRASPSVTTTR